MQYTNIKKIFISYYSIGIIFIGFFLTEYWLFSNFFKHDIINFYPRGFDQSAYLPEIYEVYLNLKSYNFLNALLISPHFANGFLFTLEHAIFMLVAGANRTSGLILNFSYFLLLQICLIYVIKKRTKQWSYAFIFIGLLLLIKS